MALDDKTLGNVARHLLMARREEALRLSKIREWFKDRVVDMYIPKGATDEYHKLIEQSRYNILPLPVASVAHNLYIDGYRSGNKNRKNSPVWDVWQANRMDARQAGIWRSALTYGYGYARVLPGQLNGKSSAVITPFSPFRVTTLYRDPINDEWPEYALTVSVPYVDYDGDGTSRVVELAVYDDTNVYTMTVPAGVAAVPTYGQPLPMYGSFNFDPSKVKTEAHSLGVTPIVRFCADRNDLDDGSEGVVEGMIPAQSRLNQTTFNLNIAEQYAAFKQKYVTGMVLSEDEEGNPIEPFKAAVDRLFVAEDETTKFGEFSETSLDGYLASRDKTLLYVTSARHIPPTTLVIGPVANVSAEALAALDNSHKQDIAEHRTSLGEDAEQMFRLAGKAAGIADAWEDTTASVRWRDTTPRSLAQTADAYGKYAQLLGVPPKALWPRLPDTTDEDLAEWDELAKENDSLGMLGKMLNGADRAALATTPTAGGGNRRSSSAPGEGSGS